MGNYSVPEEIRKQKPKGTMVKNISGHYYVYEYTGYTDENGKRKTKMGRAIGSIKPGIGFVPNDNRNTDLEISTLDFGDYALAVANSGECLRMLKEHFNAEDAVTIYTVALIHFLNQFTHLKDVKKYYDMSCLSVLYPGLKLSYSALSELYDSLGRRQGNVLAFEQSLVDNSSHQLAIDGHVIDCQSENNDLAEKGYSFFKSKENQINLMMAYDVNTETPVLSKVYQGGLTDNIAIVDFLNIANLRDMLFITDRGFYSYKNIDLLSANGNSYIIPVPSRMNICKNAELNSALMQRFAYQRNRKATIIEYSVADYGNYLVYAFRDVNEAMTAQGNYLRYIEQGNKKYTEEEFNKSKDLFGVYVIQTNAKQKSAKEIFELYKRRWKIETYYNYFKNKADCSALYMPDFYKTQGLAFMMLVCSLIHREFADAVKKLKGKSEKDCLLDARMVKINYRNNAWCTVNTKKPTTDLFVKLNTPLSVDLLHT